MILHNKLAAWFGTSLGEEVLSTETDLIREEVTDLFGYNAIQIGLCDLNLLRSNRITNKMFFGSDGRGDLICNYQALPLGDAVVDLIVIPHLLEFSVNPHEVLNETHRVLRPGGHMVISAFNPWSLWGGVRLVRKKGIPWEGQFISLPRLRDWLKLLDYDVVGGHVSVYRPPIANESVRKWFAFMDKAGPRWWPFMGGVYILHVIKRVRNMSIVSRNWGKKFQASKTFPATAKQSQQTGGDFR